MGPDTEFDSRQTETIGFIAPDISRINTNFFITEKSTSRKQINISLSYGDIMKY